MSTCPNCRQAVTSADEICENCGAVLSATIVAPIRATTTPPPSSLPPPATTASNLTLCPNCKHPLKAGEDVCDECGMVLTAIPPRTQPPPPVSSAPVGQELCPRCGGPRAMGVKFCRQCGYNYMSSTNSASTTTSGLVTVQTATQLAMGSILSNKYKIVQAIGSGGMGAVYLAEDLILKRQVVIKALLADDDPDMVAQSIKEREFLAAIKHANIVSIYDFVTISGKGYIVMEYVNGKTLQDIMEEQGRPFDVPTAIRHIMGILPAFTYMAKLGLVYCDFKPQNVMLEKLKDGSEIVKLIDLGTVIKYMPKPIDVYGTHGFYAPEAVKSPSPETDLYTICRTLAYMVTMMDLANPVFGLPSSEHYKAFRDHPALYRLLAKGTHSRPQQRFHSAEDLHDQLAGVLRLIVGGAPGVPASSRMFISGALTTTGKLGLRGEAALDETDKAIDLLRYGDLSLRNGNYASALAFYNQAIKNNSKSVDGHLRLTEIYIEQEKYAQALAEITRVQRIAPGNWKIAWYTGRLLEAQGKLTEAADQYSELLADLPGELPPQLALARVNARLGHDQEAVTLYSAVIKAEPGHTEAILGLTNSLINLKRWDEAAQVLSNVSEAAAKFVDAKLLLCDLYLNRMVPLKAQNVEQAALAIQALEGRTENARYYLMSGDVYRAAWQLARRKQLPAKTTIAGVRDTSARTLGLAAEEKYQQYLRREQHPANREAVIRRKLEVAPWRLW